MVAKVMGDEPSEAEERLRQEIAALAVDDILALCYTFQHKLARLRLYLDVLRKRGGQRAQFASCLICFDLARQGETSSRQEFAFLADTMRVLGQDDSITTHLVGEDPYLSFLWELCQAQLDDMDPRFAGGDLAEAAPAEVATVDLLSDDDFGDELADLSATPDNYNLWLRFDTAVEGFLGGEVGVPIYDPEAGFRVRSSRDVERVERFVQELDSLRELVPIARGFRALVLLFYGTHMRSKSLFGAPNQRKQTVLRDGLAEFLAAGPQVWEVAGVLNPLHMGDDVWEKISDLIIDYLQWIAVHPDEARGGTSGYDVISRLVASQPLMGNRRRGVRD
jgi:hypothetical protein